MSCDRERHVCGFRTSGAAGLGLVNPFDDECHVVACCCADQRGDQLIGDLLDGFVADGDRDVGEATETLFEFSSRRSTRPSV